MFNLDDLQGILTPEGSKNLARLIYNILLPSLIIVSLSTSVTGPKLLSWWPLPVNVLLNVALGLGLGAATFPFVRLPRHLWAHYVSMAGVGTTALSTPCKLRVHSSVYI